MIPASALGPAAAAPTGAASRGWAITDVRLHRASSGDAFSGLLGFISFRLGPLVVDGTTLRRTQDGVLTLSFPERDGRRGRHPVVRPVDAAARRELEAAILGALGLGAEAP